MTARTSDAGLPVCIVLAGGLGTRLRSVMADRPKCLAPVGRRSFLELQLELLAHRGVGRFVLSLGYMSELVISTVSAVREHFAVDYVVEPQPLGTGGGTLHTMAEMGLEEALVTNGDTWLDCDLSSFVPPLSLASSELFRMGVLEVQERSRYGGPTVDGCGNVLGFVAKGSIGPGLINAGLYRIHRKALDAMGPPGASFSLESAVIPDLAAKGCLRAVKVAGDFIDIGVPKDYLSFQSRYV